MTTTRQLHPYTPARGDSRLIPICVLLLAAGAMQPLGAADSFHLRRAAAAEVPLIVDSNTPVFWRNGALHVFSSAGTPLITVFGAETSTDLVKIDSDSHFPMWIESIWQAPDGAVYGWYHYERMGVCPGSMLDVPEVGALVSRDGGKTFTDLGIVLTSGEANDCTAQNGYFANGHGDFSVIAGPDGRYFYFLFGSYGGDVSRQGIAIARMAAEDIGSPVGTVWKYYNGAWSEPGLGGRVTPIFPAAAGWQQAETDSFWGPSVHWNTHLEKFVVLMNRSCCSPGWPQEGIYLTMTADLDNPTGWTQPVKILSSDEWYPWALGAGAGETSSEAGRTARLFVRNRSEWELVFRREGETADAGRETVGQK